MLSITPVTNTVTVGPAEALDVSVIHAQRAVWTGAAPTEGECEIQIRAHSTGLPAVITPTAGGGLRSSVTTPVRGVAIGQAVVAYRPDPAGDIVLCSATISATQSAVPAVGSADHEYRLGL